MKNYTNMLHNLKILLLNELNAPELLPYGYDTVIFVKELINYQNILVSIQGLRYKISKLSQHLKRMEIDRFEYIIRTYHRIRILKIESGLVKLNGNHFKISRFIVPECRYFIFFIKLYKKYLNNFFLKFLSIKIKTLVQYDVKIFNRKKKIFPLEYVFFQISRRRNFNEGYIALFGTKNISFESELFCTEYKRVKQLLYASLIFLL